jgi:hypothetical protein
VGNNPINANDPSGKFAAAVIGAAVRIGGQFLVRGAAPAAMAGGFAATGTLVTGGSGEDAAINFGVSAAASYALPLAGVKAATTFGGLARQGAITALGTDVATQVIGMGIDPTKNFNIGSTVGATIGGTFNALTYGAGQTMGQELAKNIITAGPAWVFPKLGEAMVNNYSSPTEITPRPSMPAYSPSYPSSLLTGPSFMSRVYRK